MADHSGAGHQSSPDDEYAFTPEGAGYEHTDAAVGPVAKFLFWLFMAAVLTHFGLAGVYKLMIDQGVKSEAGERRYPLAATEEQRLPPVPRLQQFPRNELYTFRTEERDRLETYGWESKAAGTVHIPIEEAMKLTVERGLPVQAVEPAQSETLGMMPADSSSGRTLEKRRQ
ncbi:MAG TPA: hypothetical protein VGQ37_19075 [Vicinamibacterales bacterium]|jgi:hypothetical protein|nr:hypothetical protein [Vicinamibacterales bacterium]